jgi:putative ABC transport system permease protein
MGGIYRGLVEEATLLAERLGADVWLVQRDTRGPFAERSVLPAEMEARAQVVPGVARARGFTYTTIQREHRGHPLRLGLSASRGRSTAARPSRWWRGGRSPPPITS